MKLILCLCALALTIPAAAAAKGPAHHSPPTTKNSAFACRALQAQDRAAFTHSFGTSHNGRNAFGKCVSAHARSKHLHGATLTFHDITVSSTGTVTSAGTAGCQFSSTGCTVTSAGTLLGRLGGTYASTWTIQWQHATPNGQGGYCAPATGTTTLTVPALGTLAKSEQGTVCEVGATGTDVEHVLQNGTFTTTSGTGLLSKATGNGSVTFDQKPDGTVTGAETFSTLPLTL